MCGLAVARFDFSWGDPEYHQETLENLRAAVKTTKKLCAVCIRIFMVLLEKSNRCFYIFDLNQLVIFGLILIVVVFCSCFLLFLVCFWQFLLAL